MRPLFFIALYMLAIAASAQQIKRLERLQLESQVLRDNLLHINNARTVNVYLPPGYETSNRSYPVVYYFHNLLFTADRLVTETPILQLIDRATEKHVVDGFILVAADFSSPAMGSFYENSRTSGRWLDFISEELVPFVDKRFRTIRHRDARAAVGDFMGARGALKLGMSYANLFGVVYAMHPVATGTGYLPWSTLEVDWNAIATASSFAELAGKGRTQIFVAICQAFLPNSMRPPFYCDYFFDTSQQPPVLNPSRILDAKKGFHLEETLVESIKNLQSLKGLAFDWGRFDPTQDHIYSNQAFSRKLTDLGIAHEAEEYNGGPSDKTWTNDGRFYSRVLPFLQSHLMFTER